MKKHETVAVIGRFQTPHSGHDALFESAAKLSSKRLVILIGSSFRARTYENPFTYQERANIILSHLNNKYPNLTIKVFPLRDYYYNDNQWKLDVQTAINSVTPQGESVCLVGHMKDETSQYLKWFPQWEFVDEELHDTISATDIRNVLWKTDTSTIGTWIKSAVPLETYRFLQEFINTPHYSNLKQEFSKTMEYKNQWKAAPYPPIFSTTDCTVTCAGHVLMVKRKFSPGKGLWALPGGFLGYNETLVDSAIRELREETGIKHVKDMLTGNIKGEKCFDHPRRSLRGRTVSYGFYIPLSFNSLPEIKGSDDAEKAKWIPFDDVRRIEEQIFEDHIDQINYFTGI